MNWRIIVTTIAALFVFAACASVLNGNSQLVGITSYPSQANVSINGQAFGTTPLSVELGRRQAHNISIELPGYQSYKTVLTRKMSGWFWGNILFGPGVLAGMVIDYATGGMYHLTPDQVTANMLDANIHYQDDKIFIAVVMEADPSWTKVDSLVPVDNIP